MDEFENGINIYFRANYYLFIEIDSYKIDFECDYGAYIDRNSDVYLESDKIKQTIDWNNVNPNPVNEFTIDGLATLVFVKLFLLGNADPTRKSCFLILYSLYSQIFI